MPRNKAPYTARLSVSPTAQYTSSFVAAGLGRFDVTGVEVGVMEHATLSCTKRYFSLDESVAGNGNN